MKKEDKDNQNWDDGFQTWLRKRKLSGKYMFIILGIASTIWFLFRVIPKPSRASYPCVKAVAPFMSGFVIYLLSLGSISLILRKISGRIRNPFSFASIVLFLLFFAFAVISITSDTAAVSAQDKVLKGPQDSPNSPLGIGRGVNPGLVVWAWNPDATNENCRNVIENSDWFFSPVNTDSKIVSKMVSDAVSKLGGASDIRKSWDALFKQHNKTRNGKKRGYTKGEKIFIKINQGTASWALSKEDQNNGYTVPKEIKPGQRRGRFTGATETAPFVVIELLRELINYAGVRQEDIYIGDPISHIFGHNYEAWQAEFPFVNYIDKFSDSFNRKLIKPTENDLLFYWKLASPS